MSNPIAKSYTQILTKGLQSSLNSTAIVNGTLRYTTDTGCLYLDIKDSSGEKRLKISDIDNSLSEAQILALIAPLPKIYISTDTHRAFVSSGLGMVDLAEIQLSVADVVDKDMPLWFTSTDEDSTNPAYSSDVTYNTSSKELKTPNINASESIKVKSMVITDTLNNDNTHTVRFSFS